MENDNQAELPAAIPAPRRLDRVLATSILLSAVIMSGTWLYVSGNKTTPTAENGTAADKLQEEVIPSAGVTLPVKWGDLGVKMISAGIIDEAKLKSLYDSRGGISEEDAKLLTQNSDGYIKMTPENAGLLLNLFWALGLGNKNAVLENGPMQDPRYSGAGNFASTGGWTLATGNAMEHYSRHRFIVLTAEEQALVEKVSRNIYRPCCNNPAFFPDCNHGMAMLGLLELMASQGASEDQLYKTALQANAYWFPDTYLTIAQFLSKRGVNWQDINAKEILGAAFSSATGYSKIKVEVAEPIKKTGGSCGA